MWHLWALLTARGARMRIVSSHVQLVWIVCVQESSSGTCLRVKMKGREQQLIFNLRVQAEQLQLVVLFLK